MVFHAVYTATHLESRNGRHVVPLSVVLHCLGKPCTVQPNFGLFDDAYGTVQFYSDGCRLPP